MHEERGTKRAVTVLLVTAKDQKQLNIHKKGTDKQYIIFVQKEQGGKVCVYYLAHVKRVFLEGYTTN